MKRRKTDGANGGGGKMNRDKLTELWKMDGMEKDGWRKGRRIEQNRRPGAMGERRNREDGQSKRRRMEWRKFDEAKGE